MTEKSLVDDTGPTDNAGDRDDTQQSARLPWEYCECGCKSHVFVLGSAVYGLYRDRQANFRVYRGHGQRGHEFGCFRSFTAADAAVRRDLAPQFKALQKKMTELAPLFDR